MIAKSAQKKVEQKRKSTGRKTMNISFGATKNPKVAEVIIKAIAQSQICKDMINVSLVDWNDTKNVNLLVKDIIRKIERLVSHA